MRERLNALRAQFQSLTSRLTPRERVLLGVAGASVVLFVVSIVAGSLSSGIRKHEGSIEEKTLQLQQASVYGATFNDAERQRRDLENKLGGAPVRLLTVLQELADKHALVITSMNDRGETTADQLKESLVELQIAQTPIDKLTLLLNDIEQHPRVLRVRKLRMRKSGGADPKALHVTLTVGSYQLVQKGASTP